MRKLKLFKIVCYHHQPHPTTITEVRTVCVCTLKSENTILKKLPPPPPPNTVDLWIIEKRYKLLYLFCLISNTMPQLEQSSLQPSTILHHRHQLQPSPSTPPRHLQKRKTQAEHARTPPPPLSRGVEKPEGPSALQPTTESFRK